MINNPKTVIAIASIFGLRMLGLFMAIPVISIYAFNLSKGNAMLAGFALGIYGLTQACLQLPFGMLSDRIGRKPILYMGLSLFALGSLLAAIAGNIYLLIFGRALQGAGAIGSTLIATMADFTSEKHRTKAMAAIGMTIGASFMLGFIIGPVVSYYFGVPSLFGLSTVFALFGIVICKLFIPNHQKVHMHADTEATLALIPKVLRDKELLRLDFGIFCQHAIISAMFTVIPFVFKHNLDIARNEQWLIYLPILVGSFVLSIPLIIYAEKKDKLKQVFILMIALTIISQACLWGEHEHETGLIIGLVLYFIPFNVLEATLPSMVSKTAPVIAKGTATGVYSTAQFLGIFFGATVAGILFGHHYLAMVFAFTTALAVVWLLAASGMRPPPKSRSYQLDYNNDSLDVTALQNKLREYTGILDTAILPEESAVYLKVDKNKFNEDDLESIKSLLH